MKTMTAIFSACLVTLTLTFGLSAIGEESHIGQTAEAYELLLDQYTARCDAKRKMKDSRLDNIRRAAAIAALKGAFAKSYRKELVNDMIRDEISPKPHTVDYFLNEKFYSLVREKSLEI